MKSFKSIMIVIVITLLVICLGASLAACDFGSGSVKSATAYLFIMYETSDELDIDQYKNVQLSKNNMTVDNPSDKEGYDFVDWFLDEDHTIKYDPSTYILNGDFNLYGFFTRKIYTISFVVNDEIVETQEVKYNDMVSRPTYEFVGHRINGWYFADGLPFNFSNYSITEDLTLYAELEKKKYTIYPHLSIANYVTPIGVEYGDNIKEKMIEVENRFSDIIAEGWYFDEDLTEPVDLDTYTVSGYDDLYLKFRYDIERKFQLVKLDDGTFGIADLYPISWLKDGDPWLKDGVIYYPDSFINRDGEECIISTLMTDASSSYNYYMRPIIFGKNLINIQEHAIGTNGSQEIDIMCFAAEKAKMNIADNYIIEKSKDYIVTYFGEEVKQTEKFLYTDTGNDIVILFYTGKKSVNELIIPRLIDGKPVTRINRFGVITHKYTNNECIIYMSNNVKVIQNAAFDDNNTLKCEFSESDTVGFESGWHGDKGVNVLYNQEFPNADKASEKNDKIAVEYAIIKECKADNYMD